RKEVDLLPGVRELVEERQVVVTEAVRHASVEEGPEEMDDVAVAGIPRVRSPVAVVVAEVVGLPCLRGHDDRDAMLAEAAGTDDERGVADQSVTRLHAG